MESELFLRISSVEKGLSMLLLYSTNKGARHILIIVFPVQGKERNNKNDVLRVVLC